MSEDPATASAPVPPPPSSASSPRPRPGDRARDRRGVIAFMARNGVAANLLLLAMFVLGVISFGQIVQEVFAESSLDTIEVSVNYPGATPAELEESVVQRIEEAVEAIEGVDKITATAREGNGTVSIEMEEGTDIAAALDEVKSEVDQIETFPAEADEPDIRELTTRSVVLRIALFGDVSERSLKETAFALEDEIAAMPEVSYVETSAVRDYQIFVDVPQGSLRALDLSLPEIAQVVTQSSLDASAGSLETPNEEVRLRTVGQNYDQSDFENIIVVSSGEGDLLRLGDIATVTDGFENSDLIARFNGKPVAFVDIYRTSDERVLDVAAAVKERLATSYAPPPGVEFAVWSDQSEILNDRYQLLLKNAAQGLFLVLLALTLFLDLRLAFWTAVGIGATFTGAIFVLDIIGSSINMFSLFGFILALGLVVDDAVVVGENIYAEREGGRSGLGAAIAGAQRVRTPVIFAVLTSMTSILPVLAIGGVIGNITADIPLVVVSVLGLSLVEALLVLPSHLSHLPAAGAHAGNQITRFFERVQQAVDKRFKAFVEGPLDRALEFSVKAPAVVLAAATALLIVMISLIPAGIIKVSFFPQIPGEIVSASIDMPAGSTIERTQRVTEKVLAAGDRVLARYARKEEREAGVIPDFVEAIYSTVGQRASGGGPAGNSTTLAANLADVQIALKADREVEVDAAEIEAAWREEIGELVEVRSLSISSDDISFGAAINVQLSDKDQAVLDAARVRVMEGIGRINGAFDTESDQDAGLREIELRLKPDARTLGLTVQDLANQVRAAFFGAEAVRVQRGRQDVRVYVRLPEAERDSIADVNALRVRVPGGGFTSLSAIAEANFTEAPATIRREDGRRIVSVSADVNEDAITGTEATQFIEEEILPPILADYPSLQYKFGGEQEEQLESFGDLGGAFVIALIAIYALLAIPFKSYTQPFVIMAAIPFGFIGALVAHVLLGLSIGILSLFGFVALAGVIINGSLVMIDFFNENITLGMSEDEAIVDAAKSRFRPIMLTATTTFLGVAPITFETSRQAQFLIPMAASLGFGVLIGTALLMLVIPALAITHFRGRRWLKKLYRGELDEED
ncbi:MAG: efflux RND transporter permease subunit [Erythrobacter sp.]|uniref:efflux RND transporter permease subunit n=1 Tax=Erythrobacter sp. TaxID=1042 RepID=UPI0026278320|nr:efflux RND transporter permease subunit [Erythrobacter sp.]MDJ0979655.1 efflux RND transporter permease subunit [Erythrobacter sp.]